MIYILVIVLIILVALFFMVWVRKTMWDAVHRNLLYFEDEMGGKVQRSSFASRPFYSGKYKNNQVTINFSSEKNKDKRLTYVDFSFAHDSKISFTVAAKDWILSQNDGELVDYSEWQNQSGKTFIIRPVINEKVKKLAEKESFKNLFDSQNDMAYLFIGSTSILYEFISEEVIKSSEKEELKKRLAFIDAIRKELK